ncbi:UbiA family prenyltransferase [Methanococcoides burtonii]|uniref:UbiA prenyltransferase-family protein n=1 Tax=Methanococcoides burtonii (strain DSM 6242 / NBRC 107633 / OCM 468 / ACE-M) TaxID=259564 RepID=Q12UR9_METBU|nr:UbiA family prenyltransferase [Methanococcoides burtonii]ABE52807.1 UbiA prenyltransferase-family protein [Methanococcoides burtonii DSM 6242]
MGDKTISSIDNVRFPKNNENSYHFPDISSLWPTLHLLNSSTLVSVSGALRIYIAFLLLQLQCNILSCIGGGLVVYSVYTLDRALDSEEDAVNRSELTGARRDIALFVSLLTFLMGAYFLFRDGLLLLAFLPLMTGFLYSKGIKVGKHHLKLKGGLGVKNLVVGTTWGAFIAGIAGWYAESMLPVFGVFLYFGIKLFVNSSVYDFKDIKGDALAGIKTLPVSLGEQRTRDILLSIHLFSHSLLSILIITGLVAYEPMVLVYSFVSGLVCIDRFAAPVENESKNRLYKRLFVVDGESSMIVGLRTIIGV